jgi:nicotinamidase-related amidase
LRAVAWWGIGAVPVVAVAASRLTGKSTDRSGLLAVPGEVGRRRIVASAATALALAVAFAMALALPAQTRLSDAPSGIADAVRSIAATHPGLRVFDAERWGSWLELEVPDATYFADSRIELIPASAWKDYVAVSEAQPGWEAILDRWQVDTVVLSTGDQAGLVAAVNSSDRWRVVYRDADGIVVVRA